MSKEFDEHIQPGDEVIWSDSLQCRVNLSQLRRVAKPAKIGGKLKECIEKLKYGTERKTKENQA